MELQWRNAGAADVRVLADLNAQLIVDENGGPAPDTATLRLRLHGWFTRREVHGTLFFLESDPATPVAYALWQNRGSDAFLRHFFVAREARRQGVGRAAMRLLEADILPQRLIRLEVLTDNPRGREFWNALGYTPFSITLEKNLDAPSANVANR